MEGVIEEEPGQKTWVLQKYAHCSDQKLPHSSTQEKKDGQEWQLCESSAGLPLVLRLLTVSKLLLLSHGTTVLESYSLWGAGEWLRGIRKGDSMLFIVRTQGDSRRFRVRFAESSQGGSISRCADCLSHLSPYFPIRDGDNTQPTQDPTSAGADVEKESARDPLSLPEVAKAIKTGTIENLPESLRASRLPSDQIQQFLSLCLTDPAFPVYVQQVSDALDKLTG